MSNLKRRFPDILPMEEIRVGPEAHTYEVIEYDDDPNAVKSEYVPDKAPVLDVEDVSGIVDGEDYSFQQGTDYEITDTDNDGRLETIDFSVGGKSPDANTEFEITYIARSIIVRYVESYADEFDRVANDIDEAIDSHYVDEATNTGYIDSFEDEEIVEYTTDYCVGTVSVQSDVVLQGDWALKMQNECNNDPLTITSTSGLERYPTRGDTFVYYMQLTNDGDIGYLDFMYDGSNGDYYSIRLNSASDEFILQKNNSGTKADTASVDLSNHFGTWMEVEVSTSPIGDIVATLSDASGNELGEVTIIDTEYSSGGIRWRAFNANDTGIVYADAADIVQRDSSDLDRIGAFFGELGKRRGRSDDEYTTFLRSIVQSFTGRGTVDGIKFAVASALDVEPEKIIIDENFVTNEYEVRLEDPFPPHELVTLTELADLADPSGVEFGTITYDIAAEQVDATDSVSVTAGQQVDEETSIDDTVGVNPNLTTIDEQMQADDAVFVNPNLTTTTDEVQADDAAAVDPNKTTVADDTTTNDTIATEETIVEWDTGSWDDMNWATEHN